MGHVSVGKCSDRRCLIPVDTSGYHPRLKVTAPSTAVENAVRVELQILRHSGVAISVENAMT